MWPFPSFGGLQVGSTFDLDGDGEGEGEYEKGHAEKVLVGTHVWGISVSFLQILLFLMNI